MGRKNSKVSATAPLPDVVSRTLDRLAGTVPPLCLQGYGAGLRAGLDLARRQPTPLVPSGSTERRAA